MSRRNHNLEELLVQGKQLIEFYRAHPCIAAYELLGVDLAPIQRLVFRDMWFKSYIIVVAGRGGGKTYMLGTLSALSCLLYPGYRVGLISPVFRQSKMIFAEIEKLYDQSYILREACAKKPTNASDRSFLKFKSIVGKTPSYIEALPLGDGCISSSNYLTFYNKFGKISKDHDNSLTDNHYINRTAKVWSMGKFRRSDKSLCNGIKDTIKIKTHKGFKDEGTSNHMFKVVKDGNVIWCRLDEMKVGDRILIDRSYRWHKGSLSITEDQAYTLGFLIGDGCWTDSCRCLSFATKDKELLPTLTTGIGCDYLRNATDGIHYIACSNEKCITQDKVRLDWVDFWGMDVSHTIDKKLPDKMLSTPRSIMSKCLSGLYDSDGHIHVGTTKGGIAVTIGFTNTSEELINQLHFILLHYGIVAYKKERERRNDWNTVYELLITGSDVKIFYNEIGFRLKRKQNILEWAIKNKIKWLKNDSIPGIREDMIRISAKNKVERGEGCNESRYCRASVIKRKKYINQYLAECFIKTYGHINDPAIDKIKTLADPNVYYDEIVEISTGRCTTYDIHVPDNNEYCANGFFSHNSKIRGSRFYLIVVDELAQVPDQTLDMVVRPMGATSLAPMERVHRLEEQNRLISAGLATEADFVEEKVNKMVMTSSGYYKFNHMWRRMKDHWRMMDEAQAKGKESPYSVWQVPHWDLPDGFLDRNNIIEAKRIMTSHEYSMEYEAAMVSDSEGFFKASLLEECTLGSGFSIMFKGDTNKNYILGVDPNQGGSDNCGIVVIEIGRQNKIVSVSELKRKTTQELTKAVQHFCDAFNILRVFMDRGGGGKAVMDLLEEGYGGVDPILDRTNPDNSGKDGRHILEMVNFNPSWISDANFTTKSMLEDKTLRFPELPVTADDLTAKTYLLITSLKSQMLSIVVTQTTSGLLHFDTPSKNMKKDLYSALILSAHGVRVIERELEENDTPELHNMGGLVRQRNTTNTSFDVLGPHSGTGLNTASVARFGLGAAVLNKRRKK